MLHQAPATKTQRPLFMLLCTESLDVSRSSLVWMLRAEALAIKWPCCPEENKHTADKVTKVWGGEKKKKTERERKRRENEAVRRRNLIRRDVRCRELLSSWYGRRVIIYFDVTTTYYRKSSYTILQYRNLTWLFHDRSIFTYFNSTT